jgi:hypothetical protein
VLIGTGAVPLACFQTEHAENTFPALPVRTGENVFVWFAQFPSQANLSGHLHRLERSDRWQKRVLPALSAMLTSSPQQLRLAPTARSLLRQLDELVESRGRRPHVWRRRAAGGFGGRGAARRRAWRGGRDDGFPQVQRATPY